MLMIVVSMKLTIVSYKVIPAWRKIDLSKTIPQKHTAILDGELKIKESMIPVCAVNSQTPINAIRIRIRENCTMSLCLCILARKLCWATEISGDIGFNFVFIIVELLPNKIKISLEFRCVSSI